jgi:hypothetical protein
MHVSHPPRTNYPAVPGELSITGQKPSARAVCEGITDHIRTFIPHHNGMNGVGVVRQQQSANYAARRKLAQSAGDKPRFAH